MKGQEFDIAMLKRRLEEFLVTNSVSIEMSTNDRGEVYRFHAAHTVMEITLGSAWVGYELCVDEDVAGRKNMTISLDTDLYALGGENAYITLGIFEEALVIADGLLKGRVYVGKYKNKHALAVPLVDGRYKVMYGGRFVFHKVVLGKEHIDQESSLRPLE